MLAEQIFEELRDWWHHRHHQVTEGDQMDVIAAVDSIKQHIEAFAASAKEKLEQDLPVVAEYVAKSASNPVVVALASAVHLPGAPEVMQKLAEEIATLDAALGAAKAAGAAQAQADAAAAVQPVQPAA